MSSLRTYRACHVGKAGRVFSIDAFEAASDEEAMLAANRLAKRHRVALWERNRFISSLPARLPLDD